MSAPEPPARPDGLASDVSAEDVEQDARARYESRRYQRWVARTRRPLDWLAILFLFNMLVIWSFPEASGPVAALTTAVTWFVWGCFALDYVVRLVLAADRSDFVRMHKLDLLMVLLPMLRILRVVLLLRRSLKTVSTERIASSIVAIAVVVVAFAAFLVWRVEYDAPGANIHTYRESLWWAVVTVTTVGYGNLYPVTPQGEIFATVLMVVGISLIGTISATVAAWFVRRPHVDDDAPKAAAADAVPPEGDGAPSTPARAPDDDVLAEVLARLDAISAEQARLRALLEQRAG